MDVTVFFNTVKSVIDKISFEQIIRILALVIILIIVCKILGRIFEKMLAKTKITDSVKGFIVKVVQVILYFVALLIVCDSIGIPITSVLTIFSVLGLAVSLSVQSLLSNVMNGISILMLRPFDVGDFIETDIAGKVLRIGLFYTEILTPDNKKVFIPNEKVMASKLVNYNSEGTRRIDAEFNAMYDCDPQEVMKALRAAVESVNLILKNPEPIIGIKEYGESGIIYQVWVWTDSSKYFDARFRLMDAVGEEYKKNGLKMAFNRLEVELINDKED